MKNNTQIEVAESTPLNSLLGKKIILILILVSGSITLIATLTQLYFDYKQQFNSVEMRHQEVREVHSKLMAQSLWEYDLVLLKQRMDSLVSLPDIDYLEITTDNYHFEAGHAVAGSKLTETYPLRFEDSFTGQKENIGVLHVESDTESIYNDLIKKFFTTLAINGLKTALVCYIILIIFHKSINQRIFSIMRYLRSYAPQVLRSPLKIEHSTFLISDHDELSILTEETNKLTDSLSSLYREINVEKERLADFTHVTSDWLWETDESLHIVYASEAMRAELDLDEKERPSIFELRHFYPNLNLINLLKSKQSFKQCEQQMILDGQSIYLLFQAKARYQGERFQGFRGTTINITALKDAQFQLEQLNRNLEITVQKRTEDLEKSLNQLRQTQTQLIESEKLAALGGLVAGVAHEVNTPLGISVTAASIIKETTKDLNDAFRAQTLTSTQFAQLMEQMTSSGDMLEQNLHRAANLVRDFKQTAVDQVSEKRDTFTVISVLNSLMASLHTKTRKVPVIPVVEGDSALTMNSLPGVLTQIISNLVVNSVTHAFDQQPDPQIRILFRQEEDRIIFEYFDNGSGIEKNLHQKIFEPFYTTKRGKGGSGLGLNLVFNLVHQKLKGSLEFYSEPGQGVHFVINTPQELPEEILKTVEEE